MLLLFLSCDGNDMISVLLLDNVSMSPWCKSITVAV